MSAAFVEKVKKIAFKVRNDLRNDTGFLVSNDQVEQLVQAGPRFLAGMALSGVQSIIRILVGLTITVIALYYFLADGPVMIDTVMDLSPLDSNYEQELLARFGDISRAVVVATLLSAVVQGTLAGIGYSLALSPGSPIFLLTALTMATALVPFVGAAAVWICVCVWVYLYGEHLVNGVDRLPAEMASCITSSWSGTPFETDDWLAWNLGRSRATAARDTLPPAPSDSTCAPYHTDDYRP